MDLGAYFRVAHCTRYRRITGLYAPSDERVVGPNAVDMPVSAELGAIGELYFYYASIKGH